MYEQVRQCRAARCMNEWMNARSQWFATNPNMPFTRHNGVDEKVVMSDLCEDEDAYNDPWQQYMHGRSNKQSSDSMIWMFVWVGSGACVQMHVLCMLMVISLLHVTGCASARSAGMILDLDRCREECESSVLSRRWALFVCLCMMCESIGYVTMTIWIEFGLEYLNVCLSIISLADWVAWSVEWKHVCNVNWGSTLTVFLFLLY